MDIEINVTNAAIYILAVWQIDFNVLLDGLNYVSL